MSYPRDPTPRPPDDPRGPRADCAPNSTAVSPGRGADQGGLETTRVTRAVAAVITAVAMTILFIADVRIGLALNASIVYPLLLLVTLWVRYTSVLWPLMVLALAYTFAAHFLENGDDRALLHRSLAAIGIVGTAISLRQFVDVCSKLLVRQEELEAINVNLAAREEEIARQNEELQSQTEELERQSEELRVTNDELARREKMLESLLELSRGLSLSLTQDDTLRRICDTLGSLVNGATMATGILRHEGQHLQLVCYSGFGEAGPASDELPVDRSFAALIYAQNRTGYIEDLSLRPGLVVAQPKAGKPHVSVLAAPLRVGGQVYGSIEVYATDRRAWSSEQITLIESLAQQTSTSLEASHLFEQVMEERRRLQTVLSTATVGVAIANAMCTDIRLNPAGAAMLAVPVDANLAQADRFPLIPYIGARQLTWDEMPIVRACHGELVPPEQVEMVIPTGRRLSLLMGAAPIRGDKDVMAGAVLSFVDVSELKRLQAELDARRREAEEGAVRKTRFLAAVSHDVRTPANAISLLAELIRRTAQNPAMAAEIPDMARELQQSANALVNLLGDVLDVTRFDFGKIELQETEFRLGDLLAQEVQQLLPLARDKRLSFVHLPPPAEVWVRADRIKLARVVGNLVGNAIKFTDAGQVHVEHARLDDGRVRIAVRDTGVGISQEHLNFIFDEFFQLRNPERDRNKGTGLGLTICKRLVEAMGGTINVDSTPGAGSTFTVVLPATAVIAGPTGAP